MSIAAPQNFIGDTKQIKNPLAIEPAWQIATVFPSQGQWSEGDYLLLPTNHLVELSGGNVEVLEMPTEYHQDIVIFLLNLVQAFLASTEAGKVSIAPRPVKLWKDKFREPDLLFMKAENHARRNQQYWDSADLVMEVVSENDRERDIEIKRVEYARAGITEYWIVDPMLKEITVLKLAGDRYEPSGIYRVGDKASSVLLPGFVVDVTTVFKSR